MEPAPRILVEDLLTLTPRGLYCPRGDFYVDPWQPVERAVITHAHSDHARPGSERYLCAAPGHGLLRARMQEGATIDAVPYGSRQSLGSVRVSLHPAGHCLGSAQVRIEHAGQVVVVGGDHTLGDNPTCEPFEALPCHTFVSEATFGLPIYRWPGSSEVAAAINDWWRENQRAQRTSVVFAYALGKAQRVLHMLDPGIGPIAGHGAIQRLLPAYRDAGVELPEVGRATREEAPDLRGHGLILAPPSALGTPWIRKFGTVSTAFASGWMMVRGTRRRRNVDRGFVVSDHADWNQLWQTIRACKAERVYVTHGYSEVLARSLREAGIDAHPLVTSFGEEEETEANAGEEPA